MKREDGFALVAALWLIVILSLAGLELGMQSRQRRLATGNIVDRTRTTQVALAGIAHARARLEQRLAIAGDPARPLAPEIRADPWGRPELAMQDTIEFDGGRYFVALADLGAKLNLNAAGEAELRRFFISMRIDAGAADRLAQTILDWRDPDREHRARGAERDAYLEEHAPVLPEDGPFQEVSDLRFVRGMTPGIYERVAPFLTAVGSGRVNLNAAGRPVLLALPGMTEEAVAVLLRLRRQGERLENVDQLPTYLSAGARAELLTGLARLRRQATVETREVEVMSTGWIPGSSTRLSVDGLIARGGESAYIVSMRVR